MKGDWSESEGGDWSWGIGEGGVYVCMGSGYFVFVCLVAIETGMLCVGFVHS